MAEAKIKTLSDLHEAVSAACENAWAAKTRPLLTEVKVGVMVDGEYKSVEGVHFETMRDSDGDAHIATVVIGDNY